MFFEVTPVVSHRCNEMHRIVRGFFEKSIEESVFSLEFFPKGFHRTLQDKRCNLFGLFKDVHRELHAKKVDVECRRSVYAYFVDCNRIEDLCDGKISFPSDVISWTSPLGKSIVALMDRLYPNLNLVYFKTNKRGRDSATKEMYIEYIKTNSYVCPFCSIKLHKNKKGKKREDFDHYLSSSEHPLSSVNFHNLIPTCGVCNQDYKLGKDVLDYVPIFYPYGSIPPINVKVDCKEYPKANNLDDNGTWIVTLETTVHDDIIASKMDAWDKIYGVCERLANEVHEFFEEWMEEATSRHNDKESIDEQTFRLIISEARDAAIESMIRRMAPNQVIRASFFDFMLQSSEKAFWLSFLTSRNKLKSATRKARAAHSQSVRVSAASKLSQ